MVPCSAGKTDKDAGSYESVTSDLSVKGCLHFDTKGNGQSEVADRA